MPEIGLMPMDTDLYLWIFSQSKDRMQIAVQYMHMYFMLIPVVK